MLVSFTTVEPQALDDAELKASLLETAQARSRLDAIESELLAELEARRCYVDDGALSVKDWLIHHAGVAGAVAASRARLAKRLRRMPLMAGALAAGHVTWEHARSLGRCLTPRTLEAFVRDEELLVDQAQVFDADDFDRAVTHWLRVNDPDGPDPGGARVSELHASRTLDGRVVMNGDLDVDDGAEFLAELDAIESELWRNDQALDDADPLKHRSRAQRNAAAMVEMARRSSTVRAVEEADGEPAGPRPRRPQLIAVVELAALAGDLAGVAELEDGTLLPQSTLERWACDSSLGRVVMTGASVPIDLGRASYSPSPAQRRAVIARDRHCQITGCKRKPRWCEVHHVVRFPEGPTDVANLVLLCARHHKLVHQRVLELRPAGDRWDVYRADGTLLLRERPPPRLVA